jgi:hypothetical protein
MRHDQAYDRERKNLTEEKEEEVDDGKSENETEREAFKDADNEYDEDDVSKANDPPLDE